MSTVFEPRAFMPEGSCAHMDEHTELHMDEHMRLHKPHALQDPRSLPNESEPRPNDTEPSDLVVTGLDGVPGGSNMVNVEAFDVRVAEYVDAGNDRMHAGYIEACNRQLRLQEQGDLPSLADSLHNDPLLPRHSDRGKNTTASLKPKREIKKNADGLFVCTFEGCMDEFKWFHRKCEFNKHMDKHERPYKCHQEGCAKLPGFTYSGGLLRHEREVHGKHGGPRQQWNCPHPNCKRFAGKGFSRLENLNEHVRRCHTNETSNLITILPPETSPTPATAELVEVTDTESLNMTIAPKRKTETDEDLREEIKRVRKENEKLRQQVDSQQRQTLMLTVKIATLQQQLQTMESLRNGVILQNMQSSLQPPAPML